MYARICDSWLRGPWRYLSATAREFCFEMLSQDEQGQQRSKHMRSCLETESLLRRVGTIEGNAHVHGTGNKKQIRSNKDSEDYMVLCAYIGEKR